VAAFLGLAIGDLPGAAYGQASPPAHPGHGHVFQTPAHPSSGPNTSAVTAAGGANANQNVIRTPRFIVEAVNFRAVHESGIDWPLSSDEVIAEFKDLTVDHDGTYYSMRTHEFDDVDSGETRTFQYDQSCIVGVAAPTGRHREVWLCDPRGAQAPLTFEIELF